MARNSILVVDDEVGIQRTLSAVLREEDYKVDTVGSGEECLRLLENKAFELIILDIWLPGMDGLQTLEAIMKMKTGTAVVMISGHGTIETAVRATRLGAFDFIEKPLSIEKTLLVIKNALENKHLQEENLILKSELGARYTIIGNSISMKALRHQLGIAAPTNGRVMIYGESGTGKELVAHALHYQSLRSVAPFVEVNCAAIPDELIESELFGHVKGSFTGASSNKMGKFEKADGGTLFLDEVGDMSLKVQAKVLRALEEQRFEPVGANAPVSVDVRVIAATNKNLDEEMDKGNFRPDLFYRLNVIPFYVPPLRERVEDVSILAHHFIQEFSSLYGRKPKEVSSEAMEILNQYPWPGNVRELKNLVERLVIMTPSTRIEARHLPSIVLQKGATPFVEDPSEARSLSEARLAFDRDYILKKLEENNRNISRTAEALGIERSHLYRKMRSLKISFEKSDNRKE
ncbi:MAG TPA: sigma-54 dependent transcriptional regulator [Terriglobia bacterium]|nr:sigma-54 dependent transcriptional regulator [Terriglobia bacterium]